MEFGSFDKTVGGIRITAPEMPLLVCSSCHKEDLPESTKGYVRGIVQEAKSKGTLRVNLKTNSEARAFRYNLCKDVNFSYDPMDCKIIPLLQSDFAEEGYFTPVFFEREALHKYLCFERYHVHMAGNTYGTIFRKDDWDLNFGINRNERVFCWLGDLEKIPKREQQYLLSYNVDSDHDVASEFYAATREAEFAELSDESKLLEARSKFERLCENKFRFKVFSYRIDDYEVIGKLVRPVNWNEHGVIYIINYLTKFCIETISNDSLRSEIRKLDRNSKTNDMKGLKLLEKWLELSTQNLNVPDIMKPFFVLYDFRLYLDHYMSHSTAKKTINSCYKRLGINRKDRKSEKLYDKIVERITESYSSITTNLA